MSIPTIVTGSTSSVSELSETVLMALHESSAVIVDMLDLVAENALVSLQEYFGPLIQHKHGAIVSIRADPNANKVRRPQNTSLIQSPHTDGCFMEEPPTIVALQCMSRARSGGESILVDGKRLLESCVSRLSVNELAALFHHDAYEIMRGDQKLTRAVFKMDDNRLNTGIFVSSHEFNDVLVSQKAHAGFNLLIELSRDISYQTIISLQPGQCLFLVNSRILHGRRSWVDSDMEIRHMQRAWYAYTNINFRQPLFGLPMSLLSASARALLHSADAQSGSVAIRSGFSS